MGYSSSQCTAKETGTILVLHSNHPSVVGVIVAESCTSNNYPENLKNFDEESDDELDKSTTNKASKNLLEERSVAAPSASFNQEEEDQFQKLEASDYPQ